MQVEVRLFGGLSEHARASRVTVQVPGQATVADLRAAIERQQPSLAALLPRVKVAVDLEVADDDRVIAPDDEVALLPPVAGGAGGDGRDPDGALAPRAGLPEPVDRDGVTVLSGLVRPPIDIDAATTKLNSPGVGGTAVFLGTVRDHGHDQTDVVGLDYSAYPEMADRVLADIADEIAADHPAVRGIALLHAVGELDVGDHTILIVCASAHRAEAFDACRDALERVKDRAPVWKRERTADGGHRWVGLMDPSHAPGHRH